MFASLIQFYVLWTNYNLLKKLIFRVIAFPLLEFRSIFFLLFFNLSLTKLLSLMVSCLPVVLKLHPVLISG